MAPFLCFLLHFHKWHYDRKQEKVKNPIREWVSVTTAKTFLSSPFSPPSLTRCSLEGDFDPFFLISCLFHPPKVEKLQGLKIFVSQLRAYILLYGYTRKGVRSRVWPNNRQTNWTRRKKEWNNLFQTRKRLVCCCLLFRLRRTFLCVNVWRIGNRFPILLTD